MALLVTLTDAEVYEYLRLDMGQEVGTIRILKGSAMSEAETFLNTDFSTFAIDASGVETITPVEAPDEVKEWVLNRIAEKFENRGKTIKPDYSGLQPYRVLNFSAPRNLNYIERRTPETDAINGVT